MRCHMNWWWQMLQRTQGKWSTGTWSDAAQNGVHYSFVMHWMNCKDDFYETTVRRTASWLSPGEKRCFSQRIAKPICVKHLRIIFLVLGVQLYCFQIVITNSDEIRQLMRTMQYLHFVKALFCSPKTFTGMWYHWISAVMRWWIYDWTWGMGWGL